MQYPQHILNAIDKYKDNSIFYILEIDCNEPIPSYKFGISTEVSIRVRRHCRKIGIKRVIKLIDCKYDSVMRFVETEFKRYARSIGVMIPKFGQTEILTTNEIDKYVNLIITMVNNELIKPHPQNVRNNRDANENVPKLNKCYSCGKTFRDESDFNRHKNKKTPCLIYNIADTDMKNPLRCIYCNKILSKKSHLERHHSVCKVKNGGLKMVDDSVKYEETIRIMREEHNKHQEELQQKIDGMQKTLEENTKRMQHMMNEMEKNIIERMQQMFDDKRNVSDQSMVNRYKTVNIFTDSIVKYFIDNNTERVIAITDEQWNAYDVNEIIEQMYDLGYNLTITSCKKHDRADNEDQILRELIKSAQSAVISEQ